MTEHDATREHDVPAGQAGARGPDADTEQPATGQRSMAQAPDSALLTAARQLSEEAALRPRLAGLSGVRQRTAGARHRRAIRRMTVMPAA